MAVLGYGGRLRLKREVPEPTTVKPDDIHIGSNSIFVQNPAFWSGDQVTLACDKGLPIDSASNGPDCPDGYATYSGSDWKIGENRNHLQDNASAFYKASNSSQFYMRTEECGLTISGRYYIYRDQLDRLSFYSNQVDALNGVVNNRIQLHKVDFGEMIISASGFAEYENAAATCVVEAGEYRFSDAQDSSSLASICDSSPSYGSAEYDNADLYPRSYVDAGSGGSMWMIQCGLSDWTLNLSSPEVDTTAVGERFGESIKSVITGGGTMDFLVERERATDESDSTFLMQLLLMAEKGSKADAELWMIQSDQASQSNNLLPGGLYYKTSLLVTSIAINVRASNLIVGSLNYVTVGDIALKMGTN